MMDVKRVFLYTLFFFVSFTLWNIWSQENKTVATAPTVVTATTSAGGYVPNANNVPAGAPSQTVSVANSNQAQSYQAPPADRIIRVKTDVLDLQIDTLGGQLVSANLLDYKQKLHEPKPFTLLNTDPNSFYLAQSGLLTKDQPAAAIQFQATARDYSLTPGQPLQVVLQGTTSDKVVVKKIYQFTPGSYQIGVRYELTNQGQQHWQGNAYFQIVQKPSEPVKSSFMGISSYEGGAISDPSGKRYEKVPFKNMSSSPLNKTIEGGWLAIQQHYFLTAWIPEKSAMHYYSHAQDNVYTLGATSPLVTVPAGGTTVMQQNLYVGPELTDTLAKVAPNLDMTIDYGWLWMFSAFIFRLMKWIHDVVGNWGWSIILVTCLIKLAFLPLSAKSYRSMAAMRKLQPKMEALKARYENDKEKLTKATWELYQKEKVNPFGGCLPILIQIPVFIALYWVLLESVELRQAPWILWIQDLSAKDPYFVLPIIMGLSMFVQQKLNPPAPDPMQQNMMMILPVVFTGLFLYFPAGLVLYWVVNNILSIAQQWYVQRQYDQSHK